MSKTPQLSIVVSTLNAARTLERCLQSIDKQQFRDFEVIIIDGGSTDATANIAAGYHSIVTYFHSEPDSGIYDAWNKALRIARGEWICFLGADDWLTSPVSLGKFAAAVSSNISLISARVDIVDSGGRLVRTSGRIWDARAMKNFMCVAHPGAWHHRSLFGTHGEFKPTYRLAGDYEFLLRATVNIRAAFIPECLVAMELGGISSRSYWLHVRESFTALKGSPSAGTFPAIRFLIRSSISGVLRQLGLRPVARH